MDLKALVSAAKEVDRLSVIQEARTKRMVNLAAMARATETGSDEHKRIVAESRQLSCVVVDFGNAIDDLRAALRKCPRKTFNAG